ncbi:MAG: DUF3443 family protein [Proteobacteria bacterium]|nr:DUF3443 family protein [Pseudomonadota bacterium]
MQNPTRICLPLLLLASLAALTACGGGGGGGTIVPPPPPPGQVIAGPAVNVAPLTVNAGSANSVNTSFVTVTVCVPGTATCQNIDNIEVDTGSIGLRIIASALTLNLPPLTKTGTPLAACAAFADGTSFGSVRVADISMQTSDSGASSANAKNINVQVIGDPTLLGTAASPVAPPTSCSDRPENTVAKFGANGILGVGFWLDDCGTFCNTNTSYTVGGSITASNSGTYYTCTGNASTCAASTAQAGNGVAGGQQIPHPVALFPMDKNGVIVELPAVGSGAATTSGALVFGIGTRSNNALGNAVVLPADGQGYINATYKGVAAAKSYLDSGSNATYFHDTSIATCPTSDPIAPGFYCPASALNLNVTFGTGASTAGVSFIVDNAHNVLNTNPTFTAVPSLGGPIADATSFDGGLTFFYGRNVFTAIENATTSGGTGPYTAF